MCSGRLPSIDLIGSSSWLSEPRSSQIGCVTHIQQGPYWECLFQLEIMSSTPRTRWHWHILMTPLYPRALTRGRIIDKQAESWLTCPISVAIPTYTQRIPYQEYGVTPFDAWVTQYLPLSPNSQFLPFPFFPFSYSFHLHPIAYLCQLGMSLDIGVTSTLNWLLYKTICTLLGQPGCIRIILTGPCSTSLIN